MNLMDKIKLLFKIRQPVTALVGEVKELKSGFKTVSFWLTFLSTLGAIAAALTGVVPAMPMLIATTAITVIYNIMRAFQNADMNGVQPLLLSSRFWVGILGIFSAGLMSLKTGGIDPKWVESAIGFIGIVMAEAQNMGAQQPVSNANIPISPAISK